MAECQVITTRQRGGLLVRWLSALLVISALAPTCRSAPSINPKRTWRTEEDSLPRAVLTSACDTSTGRCQGWLPIGDSANPGDYEVERDPEYDRVQSVRARGADETDLWREVPAYPTEVETRSIGVNQLPNAGVRLAKKDGFASRGRGAGGMPFSVLYMSPRPNHQPQTLQTGSAQGEKSADSSRRTGDSGRTNQSSYRVATRNGGYGQPRRHYSIIPQLFLSYGWRPSGKLVQGRSDFGDASGKVSPSKSR